MDATLFTLAPATTGAFAHRVGGEWDAAHCPNCAKPLIVVLALDLSDPALGGIEAGGDTLVPLLFCWTCPIPYRDFVYAYRGGVALIEYAAGQRDEDFPYENYPDRHPALDVVVDGAAEPDVAVASPGLVVVPSGRAHPGELAVGQEVFFYHASPCRRCGQRLWPLALVWDAWAGLDLCGNSGVAHEFYRCARCGVIKARHHVD